MQRISVTCKEREVGETIGSFSKTKKKKTMTKTLKRIGGQAVKPSLGGEVFTIHLKPCGKDVSHPRLGFKQIGAGLELKHQFSRRNGARGGTNSEIQNRGVRDGQGGGSEN